MKQQRIKHDNDARIARIAQNRQAERLRLQAEQQAAKKAENAVASAATDDTHTSGEVVVDSDSDACVSEHELNAPGLLESGDEVDPPVQSSNSGGPSNGAIQSSSTSTLHCSVTLLELQNLLDLHDLGLKALWPAGVDHHLAAKIVANPALVTSGPIAEPQPHNQSETDLSFAGDLAAHHRPPGSANGLGN